MALFYVINKIRSCPKKCSTYWSQNSGQKWFTHPWAHINKEYFEHTSPV